MMDHKEEFCSESRWQASMPIFMHNMADKWQEAANTSISHCQPPPKQWTPEAIFVLCVYLLVGLLCLIGSLINAFESSCKTSPGKKVSQNSKDQKADESREREVPTTKKEDESPTSSGWKENCKKFLECFSLQTNARKILSITKSSHPESIDCIDGIRALIFIWIFITHFFFYLSRTVKNLDEKLHLMHDMPISEFAGHGAFGVDAFVILSGFLTAYAFSNYYEKNNGKIPWSLFYAIRVIRVTPVYMAVLGFYATLFNYMGSSPIWPTYNTNPVCKEKWIWNLLFVNNFYTHYEQCMSMTYFLGCIMQLYVISPLFLVPLNRWPKFGYFLTFVALCLSCYASFLTSLKHNLFGVLPKSTNLEVLYARAWQLIDVYHQQTYVKLTPYAIGLALGYYLHRRKLTKKDSLLTLLIGWILYAGMMWFAFFALYKREESVLESAVYNGFKSLLYSLGFSWLFYVCATKQGGLISKLVCHPILKPISRISFSGFLTQTIVFEGYFLLVDVFDESIDISLGLMANLEWVSILAQLILWTFVTAFAIALMFEYPVIRLLHTCFAEKKKTL